MKKLKLLTGTKDEKPRFFRQGTSVSLLDTKDKVCFQMNWTSNASESFKSKTQSRKRLISIIIWVDRLTRTTLINSQWRKLCRSLKRDPQQGCAPKGWAEQAMKTRSCFPRAEMSRQTPSGKHLICLSKTLTQWLKRKKSVSRSHLNRPQITKILRMKKN